MSADAGAAWPPIEPQTCLGCGSQVSAHFERVFGDNEDRVHACLNCEDRTALKSGATRGDSR